MSGRSSRYRPATPYWTVWRLAARSIALMLAEMREYADCGHVVHVLCSDGGSFEVIRNGERYLVRSAGGNPLATVATVLEAMMAGDAHLDRPPPENDDRAGGTTA